MKFLKNSKKNAEGGRFGWGEGFGLGSVWMDVNEEFKFLRKVKIKKKWGGGGGGGWSRVGGQGGCE